MPSGSCLYGKDVSEDRFKACSGTWTTNASVIDAVTPGTSMSAPYVAGAAALLAARYLRQTIQV